MILGKVDTKGTPVWLKRNLKGPVLFYLKYTHLFLIKLRNTILDCHLDSTGLNFLPDSTFWTAPKMIHNTLKSPQLSDHNHRRTNSAAQRKLWRYSGCRGGNQVESHRRSVCVLAADLNAGDGGGRGAGGEGVIHTIHGLCHLCIGCRLPQVCLLGENKRRQQKEGKMRYEEGPRSGC